MRNKIFLILFLSIFHTIILSGQNATSFYLQRYDNRNGLSNSSINHLYKDGSNLLWVATWDGLNMYDGSTFHVFNYSKENDLKSIGSNVIRQVAEDGKGNIWIATIEGITRYNKTAGNFYNYFYNDHTKSNVSEQEFALATDGKGKVICFSQKALLTVYNPATDSFEVDQLPNPNIAVTKMAFDGNGHLWILDAAGKLGAFEIEGKRYKALQSFKTKSGVNNFYLVNGKVFYTSTDDVLYGVDNKTFTTQKLLQLKHPMAAIIYYQQHYLLAWATKGFSVYNDQFQTSGFLQQEVAQMQDVRITSLATGTEDIVWCGTDGNGIIKLYPKTKAFATVATAANGLSYNKSVRAFCGNNGQLWVATKGSGIITINHFSGDSIPPVLNNEIVAPDKLDNNSVYALQKAADGLIYIGSDAIGIGVFDTKQQRFFKWGDIAKSFSVPAFGSVYAIYPDADNSLWLGTSGYGLVHVKLERTLTNNLRLILAEKLTFTNSNTGPANNIIYAITEADKNHLWIGCRYGGLNLFDKRTHTFKTYKAFTYEGSLSNNDVLSLYKDKNSNLWVGTSYGLNYLPHPSLTNDKPVFTKFTTAEGLPNNTIHAIEEDGKGNIWLSTNKGLAKVEMPGKQVSYYQQVDGLQSNEFCDGAVWKDSLGKLFFGGTYGFNHFYPKDIGTNSWLPNLLVSGIYTGGKPADNNGFITLQPGTNTAVPFTLDRKDNSIELNIKALSFLNAEKCEYAYFLESYDKAWHYAGTNGKMMYGNIDPGSYVLRLKWSNGEGAWTKEITFAHITVRQYFWLTGYAYTFYLLLLSAGIFLFYRYRKNKTAIRHQLEVEHLLRTKEEELHRNRLGFFTNIAHELQTPLTLIMGGAERYLQKTAATKDSKDRPYFLSMIHQQASRLTYLVQQLLEFRKSEDGFYKNQFSYLNISELLQNLADPFTNLGEQNGLAYKIAIDAGVVGLVDKDKMEKIVFNLLSNAFKHSSKNERVVFKAAQNNTGLEITVSNSGVHLSSENLNRLFDKFYTADLGHNQQFGTGIGLAFTQQLVHLLNGNISVINEQDCIVFKVVLPFPKEGGEAVKEAGTSNSDQPSYLYKTITAYSDTLTTTTAGQNKQALIEQVNSERKNILVIEDDADIRYLLKDIFKDDYVVHEAGDGIDALAVIEKIRPHLVVCDIMMPHMNGLELCNKMKNNPATCQIPFVLLSARNNEENHLEGYEVGADAYIDKPFNTSHLKLRVKKLLENQQRLHDFFKNGATEAANTPELPDADRVFLQKLTETIQEHIAEEELNAEFLEKEFHLSKMQLYRRLKTLTDMTPTEFIKRTRLQQAAVLLKSTRLNVTEIFYQTGFNNQSYFFREFKKIYNCSPNEYREGVHSTM